MNKDSLDLTKKICSLLAERKAEDIMYLDISELTVVADSFIICSGRSAVQLKAACDFLEEKLALEGIKPARIDGYNEGRWIVLDYSNVIVHIFKDEDRVFYHLERLWSNGKNMFLYQE
ncbi:MAG TPA: ribosome silencing factor [Firmicutes bacterium]|nr:ribosome silencing factor [Bacillota bacterium]